MDIHLTTKQAADYLNVPPSTLTTWRCTKRVQIPFFKLGGNVRYKKSDLDAFVAAHTCSVEASELGN